MLPLRKPVGSTGAPILHTYSIASKAPSCTQKPIGAKGSWQANINASSENSLPRSPAHPSASEPASGELRAAVMDTRGTKLGRRKCTLQERWTGEVVSEVGLKLEVWDGLVAEASR